MALTFILRNAFKSYIYPTVFFELSTGLVSSLPPTVGDVARKDGHWPTKYKCQAFPAICEIVYVGILSLLLALLLLLSGSAPSSRGRRRGILFTSPVLHTISLVVLNLGRSIWRSARSSQCSYTFLLLCIRFYHAHVLVIVDPYLTDCQPYKA